MLKMNVNPFEFDSRMIEWNLKHNILSKEKLKAYLDALPDSSGNMEPLRIDEDAAGFNGSGGSHSQQ